MFGFGGRAPGLLNFHSLPGQQYGLLGSQKQPAQGGASGFGGQAGLLGNFQQMSPEQLQQLLKMFGNGAGGSELMIG